MHAVADLFRGAIARARSPTVRPLLEFAESEIVLPSGEYRGSLYRREVQPWTGLFLAALDSGRFRRWAIVKPRQAGGTLCLSILLCYELFELHETTIYGIPDYRMADDKWRGDIRPLIERTRYAPMLPTSGPGSRGGPVVNTVRFGNGATLKLMGGGGGDAQRAGFTARRAYVTEADKFDVIGGTSRETDKLSQLEHCTDSYARYGGGIGMECTPTFTSGRIWREYLAGSRSRIVCRCPHCRADVSPERQHLIGWQKAETPEQAKAQATWVCPSCAAVISDPERARMNRDARIEHDNPESETFTLRISAWHNLFWTAGTIAASEWKAANATGTNETAAQRELMQYVWALPVEESGGDLERITWQDVAKRQEDRPRGLVPPNTARLVVACDIGKRLLHWTLVAYDDVGRGRISDYNVIEVASDALGEERAILAALRDFRELCAAGWRCGPDQRRPDVVVVDSGTWAQVVYAFVRESGRPYWPFKGWGAGINRRWPSHGYLVEPQDTERVSIVSANADHWKTLTWSWLRVPTTEPGALTLWHAEFREHTTFAHHCTAEVATIGYSGPNELTRWDNANKRPNHWWDCLYMSGVAAHMAGIRTVGRSAIMPKRAPAPPPRQAEPRPAWMNRRPFRRDYG
jgi:phage terminase large subunit GpA-like protein